ncbi:Patatin [Herpetosiphon aurantiacus DSM 785]|uniref:Patatin n=1 Tax=Herpetosiphon aurantiacus (strain ATCC 23779 / DSM 785 / 114-95) TaxID=316274 RepID=A9B071_HERA2|nr:Patatin [Herpetosiphon aurantiacus DSM 785]
MNIVSIDGGGYLGVASLAFIEEIERFYHTSFHQTFTLFCGTSTGAIIALGLASGKTGKELMQIYTKFGSLVFNNRLFWMRKFRLIRGFFLAQYSNTALRKLLKDFFGDITLGDIKAQGKRVIITAFNLSNGKPRVFKTDHSADLNRDDRYYLRDIALASSAAPIYLPIVTLQNPHTGVEERFCDGGVFANHPALLGYAEAVSHLAQDPQSLKILSIATPRAELGQNFVKLSRWQQTVLSRGVISWSDSIASIAIDATSMIAHETLRRVFAWQPAMQSRYVRITLPQPQTVALDIANESATRALRNIGFEKACEAEIRNKLSGFFNE